MRAAIVALAAGFLAGAPPAAAEECNSVCHLQYWHKGLATPDPALSNAGACQEYAGSSCCTAATANNVHNDVLYGEEYRWDRCGELSPACQQYFIDEACLYECDEHAGRYRHHTNCSDEDANTWQMMGMPIKASFWDSWYEACKDDLFCGRGYFDMPTCNAETDCSKFSDIYDDAEDMATAMWNNAFTYERDEENAYTMGFEAGQPNPNDAVEHAVEFPDLCTGTKHDNITGEIKETGEVCHETSETSEPAAKTNSSPASTLSVTVAATLAAAAATAALTV